MNDYQSLLQVRINIHTYYLLLYISCVVFNTCPVIMNVIYVYMVKVSTGIQLSYYDKNYH